MKTMHKLFGCGLAALVWGTSAQALPLSEFKIDYRHNANGGYTYYVKLNNAGPIAPGVTTAPAHTIMNYHSFPPSVVAAGSKSLDDDANVVLFGVDTGKDSIIVRDISDADAFHGTEEQGFYDNDGDGVPNQVVAWHLPFYGWTVNDTVQPGEQILVTFTLNTEIKVFDTWIGGSDDAVIWNDRHTMLEDSYGIFDANDSQYVATFLARTIVAKKIREKHDDEHHRQR